MPAPSFASFQPVTLELIEEGNLLQDLNAELDRVQRQLCHYVDKHGSKAEKASASVSLKVTLRCESIEDYRYSIKGEVGSKLPNRPPRLSLAMQLEDEPGQPCLFARAPGTSETHPRQSTIFSPDHPPCDAQTGEVVDNPTEEVTTRDE